MDRPCCIPVLSGGPLRLDADTFGAPITVILAPPFHVDSAKSELVQLLHFPHWQREQESSSPCLFR